MVRIKVQAVKDISFNRLILSAIGGWVLNSFEKVFPEKGKTINIWAVAWFPERGICLLQLSNLPRALLKNLGFPLICAP